MILRSTTRRNRIRNWLDLPDDVTAKILVKLSPIEILLSARQVCVSWRRICKHPSMWRRIDMSNLLCNHLSMLRSVCMTNSIWREPSIYCDSAYLWMMCRHAVDLSDGQLIDIDLDFFGLGGLLQYIAKRSRGLKRIRLVSSYNISNEGLMKAAAKLPLLEDLELTNRPFTFRHRRPISKEALKAVGKSCPLLKSFKFNAPVTKFGRSPRDDQALAIAENMPGLHRLELVGNMLTNNGLYAILDGCPQLESLDLRECNHISVRYDELKHRVKSLRLPVHLL